MNNVVWIVIYLIFLKSFFICLNEKLLKNYFLLCFKKYKTTKLTTKIYNIWRDKNVIVIRDKKRCIFQLPARDRCTPDPIFPRDLPFAKWGNENTDACHPCRDTAVSWSTWCRCTPRGVELKRFVGENDQL